MLRWLTAGESHGRALVAICEGMPAGVRVSTEDVAAALARRRAGHGRGARMKFEQDEGELTGGGRGGAPPRGPAAARVALGEVAGQFLRQAVGAEVLSHVVALGPVSAPAGLLPAPEDAARIDADPVRCADAKTSQAMVDEIDQVRKDGDTLGGGVEVGAYGLPPGLGSFTHWDRRLDARLAGALMGIQAMKGVEIGDGFTTARRRGSAAHDEIEAGPDGVRRRTNRAGGLEGGMTNGELLRGRVAMKPISTVPRALATIDVATGEPAKAINQRSDATAVPASGVVAEAMVALVLADAVVEKFGGDSVAEIQRNAESYLKSLVIT